MVGKAAVQCHRDVVLAEDLGFLVIFVAAVAVL
jgi:hypothetical protein